METCTASRPATVAAHAARRPDWRHRFRQVHRGRGSRPAGRSRSVDADAIGRQILEPGGLAYQPVVDHFGPGVVRPDGSIDRPALAAAVFNDQDALADLNRLTHPLIARVMAERGRRGGGAGTDHHPGPRAPHHRREGLFQLSAVIVVDTPEEVAVQRLVAHRGFSEEDAVARVASQVTREERRQLADLVLDNGGDRCALESEIDRAWVWLRERAART